MKNKKIIGVSLVTILLLISVVLLIILFNNIHIVKEYDFVFSPDGNKENSLNYIQNSHDYSTYLCKGRLFFYIDGSDNSNYSEGLYEVTNSRAIKILSFRNEYNKTDHSFCKEKPLCFVNGSLLYCVNSSDITENAIISFDIDKGLSSIISSGEDAKLITDTIKGNYAMLDRDSCNKLIFRCYDGEHRFIAVSNTSIEFVESCNNYSVNDSFSFGDFNYYWEEDIWLTQTSSHGDIRIAPLVIARPIIDVLDGNAIIVSRSGESGFWKISKNGEAVQLFPDIEGEKKNIAYQVYGNNLYISVRRYKKYQELDVLRFKNDSYEGFWKVDLLTGKKEKISSKMYKQLYIYDDSGIIACSYSGDIVLLDFNGKEKATIVSGSVFNHWNEFYRNKISRAE